MRMSFTSAPCFSTRNTPPWDSGLANSSSTASMEGESAAQARNETLRSLMTRELCSISTLASTLPLKSPLIPPLLSSVRYGSSLPESRLGTRSGTSSSSHAPKLCNAVPSVPCDSSDRRKGTRSQIRPYGDLGPRLLWISPEAHGQLTHSGVGVNHAGIANAIEHQLGEVVDVTLLVMPQPDVDLDAVARILSGPARRVLREDRDGSLECLRLGREHVPSAARVHDVVIQAGRNKGHRDCAGLHYQRPSSKRTATAAVANTLTTIAKVQTQCWAAYCKLVTTAYRTKSRAMPSAWTISRA